MTTFTFIDYLTNENLTVSAKTEENAWEALCDKMGTGYVFENIDRI